MHVEEPPYLTVLSNLELILCSVLHFEVSATETIVIIIYNIITKIKNEYNLKPVLTYQKSRVEYPIPFYLSSLRGVRAFHELRRYHTRPLRLNWGPENVHFGKTHFRNPNIIVKIFIFLENLKNYQAQLFYFLHFPLGYLKTAQKSSKNAEK